MRKTILFIALVGVISTLGVYADSAFFELVETGTAEAVQAAIHAGADVNVRNEGGETALMYAARYNENPDVIKLLLDAGADGKARDESGKTAFDYAKDNEAIRGTGVYWRLNDAQY